MLATIVGRVRTQQQAGKSLDAIVASRPTADFDAEWKGTTPPAVFIGWIYRSLQPRPKA